jgi:thiamine transport system permease protein
VLGGGSATTIEVEIWFQTTQLLRLDVAAVLSIAQLVVVAAVLVLYQRTLRGGRAVAVRPAGGRRRPATAAERAVVALTIVVEGAAVAVPVGELVVRSLRVGDGWGLDHYRHLGSTLEGTALAVSPLHAIGNSLLVGVIAAAAAVAVGVPAAAAVVQRRRGARWLDGVLMLPLATSAATVGFGILVAYRTPPFDLRGSVIAIPLVEATIAAPLVARSLIPVFAGVDQAQLDAARCLGASPLRRLTSVAVPAVRPAIGVAAALAFAVSLGEFGATVFIARPDNPTLPVAVARLLSRPGDLNYGQAMALSTILMVVCAVALLVLERLRTDRTGEF